MEQAERTRTVTQKEPERIELTIKIPALESLVAFLLRSNDLRRIEDRVDRALDLLEAIAEPAKFEALVKQMKGSREALQHAVDAQQPTKS